MDEELQEKWNKEAWKEGSGFLIGKFLKWVLKSENFQWWAKELNSESATHLTRWNKHTLYAAVWFFDFASCLAFFLLCSFADCWKFAHTLAHFTVFIVQNLFHFCQVYLFYCSCTPPSSPPLHYSTGRPPSLSILCPLRTPLSAALPDDDVVWPTKTCNSDFRRLTFCA